MYRRTILVLISQPHARAEMIPEAVGKRSKNVRCYREAHRLEVCGFGRLRLVIAKERSDDAIQAERPRPSSGLLRCRSQ
jgi:hypothetical protein